MSAFAFVVVITAIAGVVGTGLGGLLGVLFTRNSEKIVSLLLSFASGAMLYVVFGELLPESILMWRSKAPAFAMLVGLLVGVIILFV